MYIILLTLLGLGLRLINIDKPEGLWNDEYVSWFVASTPFHEGFWQEILKQCHMPFYYLYLKPFVGFSDLILRLTSTIPALISIPIMFLVGKEYSRKTGYIAAGVTTILPFLIYYSQEVRFYSLLFLFSALTLLFTIKLIKGKKAWTGYIISSILILGTHVLGGIYIALTLAYIFYKKKALSPKVISIFIILGIIIMPLGINILNMLPSSQWWGKFSYTNILFLFSDYLSPILTNNINAPEVFFYSKNLLFVSLILIPTLLGIFSITRGAKKEKGLFLIGIATILFIALLALCGKLVFITKYTIEILPIIILLFSLGIKGSIGQIILSTFIAFQLFAIFTPYYPTKIYRSEGHKLVANILNKTNSDNIVFTYYEPNRFYKYLNTNAKMTYISKINRFEYLDAPERILKNINIGKRVSVVFLDSVSFIPPNSIENAKNNKIPEMFISFSIIRNALIKELDKNFGNFNIEKQGSWTVITARRLR